MSKFAENIRTEAVRTMARRMEGLRYGQAVFNTAMKHDPENATRLVGTEFDPFYDSSLVEGFLAEMVRLRTEQGLDTKQ